jgi:hypothetical protein
VTAACGVVVWGTAKTLLSEVVVTVGKSTGELSRTRPLEEEELSGQPVARQW